MNGELTEADKIILDPNSTYEDASAAIQLLFNDFCTENGICLEESDYKKRQAMRDVFEQGFRRGLMLGLDAGLQKIRWIFAD